MTTARSELVDGGKIADYHCFSRCVRRAFLCGRDQYSGKDYEHRRGWIQSRLCLLEKIFALDIIAYAVMTNHVHTILRTRPDTSASWTSEEVARRWCLLFPRNGPGDGSSEPDAEKVRNLVNQPELIQLFRKRLSCISWFHRCLNENIARHANVEDEVRGRFWEGRFKCQRLDSISSLIACSVYVDLNPIRAHMATTPEQSDFTSVKDRIDELGQSAAVCNGKPALLPIDEAFRGRLTTRDYLQIVDGTGRVVIGGKGAIPDGLSPILERLNIRSENWVMTTTHFGSMFKRVVAPVDRLKIAAQEAGRCWFQGARAARLAFIS